MEAEVGATEIQGTAEGTHFPLAGCFFFSPYSRLAINLEDLTGVSLYVGNMRGMRRWESGNITEKEVLWRTCSNSTNNKCMILSSQEFHVCNKAQTRFSNSRNMETIEMPIESD